MIGPVPRNLSGNHKKLTFPGGSWRKTDPTFGFAPKFCAKWYGRELRAFYGHYFRELFRFLKKSVKKIQGIVWKSYGNRPEIDQNRAEIDRKSTGNRPEIDRRSTGNRPEVDRKSTGNRPEKNRLEFVRKSSGNRPESDRNLTRNRVEIDGN